MGRVLSPVSLGHSPGPRSGQGACMSFSLWVMLFEGFRFHTHTLNLRLKRLLCRPLRLHQGGISRNEQHTEKGQGPPTRQPPKGLPTLNDALDSGSQQRGANRERGFGPGVGCGQQSRAAILLLRVQTPPPRQTWVGLK